MPRYIYISFVVTLSKTGFKGAVQRDGFGSKWYRLVDHSSRESRRDFSWFFLSSLMWEVLYMSLTPHTRLEIWRKYFLLLHVHSSGSGLFSEYWFFPFRQQDICRAVPMAVKNFFLFCRSLLSSGSGSKSVWRYWNLLRCNIHTVDRHVCWNSNRRLPFIVCQLRKTIFRFPFTFAANKLPLSISVQSKQMEVAVFISSIFRLYI